MFPYEPPQLQTTGEIRTTQQLIGNDFVDLQIKLQQSKKKQKKVDETLEDAIDKKNPFNGFDDFWWEDDLFNKNDSVESTEVSKNILDNISEMSENIFKNLRPVDNRNLQELIDNDFIKIDDRTQQELEDEDYNELESPTENVDINLTSAWDSQNTTIDSRKARIKLSTNFNQKVRAANKIKKKYRKKKKIGN